jgi:hypothetical protein
VRDPLVSYPYQAHRLSNRPEFQEMNTVHVRSCLTRQVLLPTIQEPKFLWRDLPEMVNGKTRNQMWQTEPNLVTTQPFWARHRLMTFNLPTELLEHASPVHRVSHSVPIEVR